MERISRRRFLQGAGAACVSCSLMLRGWPVVSAEEAGHYYLKHREELVGDFKGALEGVLQYLTPEFGKERSQEIVRQALGKFESLLPGLPDVGGERNIDSEFIPMAAWYVALYEPMRERGKTAEDVGRLIYDLYVMSLEGEPPEALRAQGAALFTPEGQEKFRQWAQWTQQRRHEANWVAQYQKGNGKDYDFSITYSECGVVKYLQSQQVPELAPYVCPNDFSKSRALGSGLQRTKTIARGDGFCNFQYKKDRTVVQDWHSELKLIREKKS